jgi:hypothetical protein
MTRTRQLVALVSVLVLIAVGVSLAGTMSGDHQMRCQAQQMMGSGQHTMGGCTG